MTQRHRGPDSTLLPGERLPAPEATEREGDTAWELWHDLSSREQVRFADTVPAHIPLEQADRHYAATVPAGLAPADAAQQVPARAAAAALTADDVMAEARRNNRVCPQQAAWVRLHAMLEEKAGRRAPPPLTGAAWSATPSLAKRMSLRAQIEWAARADALADVMLFFKALPESDWHHMGD